MPPQAAVQGAAGEFGDRLAQAAQDVVQRQEGAPPELDDDRASSASASTVLLGLAGPIR